MTRSSLTPSLPLRFAALALFALGLIGLPVGCTSKQETGEQVLGRIKGGGTIRIAYANEKPYGYRDTKTGKVTGEAPEIARVIAKRLGTTKIEPVITEFGQLIPGLKAGRFDVVAAGMYITPKRAEQVLFSNPTYAIGEALLVRKGNPKDIHSYEDIAKSKDLTIGVVAGAIEKTYARKVGIPDARIRAYPAPDAAVADVKAGRVDCYAGTSLTVSTLLGNLGDEAGVERVEPFTQPVVDGKSVKGFGGFVFRKGHEALRDAFNKELKGFLGTEEHRKLVKPFGFTEKEGAGGMTTEQVLARSKPQENKTGDGDADASDDETGETAAKPDDATDGAKTDDGSD